MKIQTTIILMGDRLRLYFFVDESLYYDADKIMIWFEDESGKEILGDNYIYYIDKFNKKDIKAKLKECFPGEKGLYKEFKMLINKMKDYEYPF